MKFDKTIQKMMQQVPRVTKREVRKFTSRGLSLRATAKKFRVPITTLHRVVNEPYVINRGRQQYLTMQMEKQLIATAEDLSSRGFGLTLSRFLELATDMVNSIRLKSTKNPMAPITTVSYKWWEGFKSRHPDFRCCHPKGRINTNKLKAEQNKEAILSFYKQYKILDRKYKFTPSQVWNADETGSSQKESAAYIVANRNQKTIGGRVSSNATHMTLLACISADGNYSPPLFICKGQKVEKNILDNALQNSMVATSSSGYINEKIFNQWFDKWITWVRKSISSRVVLIVDNCTSHVKYSTVLLAKKHNVELLALPPNLTHILQPLDVGIFRSFKSKMRSTLESYLVSHRTRKLNNAQFIQMLSQTVIATFTSDSIKSAFTAIGLFPINANKAFERVAKRTTFNTSASIPKRNLQLDTIGKLHSQINDLKTEVARLQSNAVIVAAEAAAPKQRRKKLMCVVARVLTQEELEQRPTISSNRRPKIRKRKPSFMQKKLRTRKSKSS